MTSEYVEYVCDVCEMRGMCRNGSRPMLTSFGLKVCCTGCAMRAWKFSRCIDKGYEHTVTSEELEAMSDSEFMRHKRCECGCRESFMTHEVNHYECPSHHLQDGAVVALDNSELEGGNFGHLSKYKCTDCGEGLMKYQKTIIDAMLKSSNN